MPHQKTDDTYLCQVSETVSCGACCGLYNLPDSSFPALSKMLARRTALFTDMARDMEAILAFGASETALTGPPPMADFHHCPYLGLIGPEKSRVGCLLHPMGAGNHGIDYRGLSHYGSMTCQLYFCPTHRRIPSYMKILMCRIIDNWHAFGLIVPEADLLAAMDKQIQARVWVENIDPQTAMGEKSMGLWRTLLTLKQHWPYRAPDRFWANYFFNDGLYAKPPVDYTKTGQACSRHDGLFRELHTVFENPEDLLQAEMLLDRLFDDLAAAISA